MVAEYRRRVVDWLESRGATNIVWGNGGKRCRLSFRLNGVDRTFPVARTPGDGDIHRVIIGQLNRDLGRPPERLKSVPPPTAPFSERIVSMGLAQRQGDLLVYSDFKEMEERVIATERDVQPGASAMYHASGGHLDKRRLQFRWPASMGFNHPGVELERLGDWEWAIKPGPDRIDNTGETMIRKAMWREVEFQVNASDYEPNEYGMPTPCSFMLVDGTLMAVVSPQDFLPVKKISSYTKGPRLKAQSLSELEVRERVNDIRRLLKEVQEGSGVELRLYAADGNYEVVDIASLRWIQPQREM